MLILPAMDLLARVLRSPELRDLNSTYGISTTLQNFGARLNRHAVPVHEINDDLSWTIGNHTLQMGGVLRIITNHRTDEAVFPFPCFDVNNGFCVGLRKPPSTKLRRNPGLPTPTSTPPP